MPKSTVSFVVTITRPHDHQDHARICLRKQVWSVGVGQRSRELAVAYLVTTGMGEHEIVEDALRELLRAYCDTIG